MTLPDGPQILIVDDSEDDVLLASAYIRRRIRSARFRRVDSGPGLKAALDAQRWDLILCDHHMPGFDSTAALAMVREVAPDASFFVYSGDLSRSEAASALSSGADGVLEKRDTSGLLRIIDTALGSHTTLPA